MCTISMISDHFHEKWVPDIYHPQTVPFPQTVPVPSKTIQDIVDALAPVTRQEFDQLKHDVEEMKALLIRAKLYDEENDQPDCQMEEKVDLLRRVAELVGVSLEDILPSRA